MNIVKNYSPKRRWVVVDIILLTLAVNKVTSNMETSNNNGYIQIRWLYHLREKKKSKAGTRRRQNRKPHPDAARPNRQTKKQTKKIIKKKGEKDRETKKKKNKQTNN